MRRTAEQFDLFVRDRPRSFNVSGATLSATLAKLKAAGAVIDGMEWVNGHNGQWRLRVRWPDAESLVAKTHFLL